jgi:hypothetical protein
MKLEVQCQPFSHIVLVEEFTLSRSANTAEIIVSLVFLLYIELKMSWQVAPGCLVVIACFSAVGLVMPRLSIFVDGRVSCYVLFSFSFIDICFLFSLQPRRTRTREYEHQMDLRDKWLNQELRKRWGELK